MNTWVVILHRNGSWSLQSHHIARHLVAPSRIVTVGPSPGLRRLDGLTVARPVDCGTTPDLLLALFHVLARDLAASVVVLRADVGLPADGGVQEAVTAALMACDEGSSRVLLVGAETYPYGGAARHVRMAHARGEPWPRVIGLTDVRQGPTALPAGELVDTGILVADAWTLVDLIRARVPRWFRALRRVVWNPAEMEEAFATLEASDFVDDVLLPSVEALHVVPALRGWEPRQVWPGFWHPFRGNEAME